LCSMRTRQAPRDPPAGGKACGRHDGGFGTPRLSGLYGESRRV
jgi:hypothetical protein